MRVRHRDDELENLDRGLDYDLPRLLQRPGPAQLAVALRPGGWVPVAVGYRLDSTCAV
jgi:hypothetical protein